MPKRDEIDIELHQKRFRNSSTIRFLAHDEIVWDDAFVVRPDCCGSHDRLFALVVEVARDGVCGAVDVGVVGGLVFRRLLAPVRRLGQRIRLVRVAPASEEGKCTSYLGLSDSMGDDLHEMVSEWSSELRSVLEEC